MTGFRQALSVFLSISVVMSVMGLDGCSKKPAPAQAAEAQQAQPGGAQQAPPGEPPAEAYVALIPDQLDQLVAPIALYPDALLAQILGAATFPDQIAAATGWLQQNKSLTGTALMQAVNEQPWVRLLQLRVFCLGFFQDWDVGVGVFPEREEILIGGFGFGGVALHGISATQLEARQCPDR